MSEQDMGAVVVTGSSTGIGRATALLLDGLGFKVFAGVRKEEDAESLRQAASPRLTPLFIDIADRDSVAQAAATVTRTLEGQGLAGLVNNAAASFVGPLECSPWEDFVYQIEVNLLGHVAVTRAFLKLIRISRGRVVNIGSIGGIQPIPLASAYDACKAGIHALTDSLRMELVRQGIFVILVIPGHIATPVWGKLTREGDRLQAALSGEDKALYGPMIDAFRLKARKMGLGGLPAEAVAKVVAKALTARKPRTRYLVGRGARLRSILVKLLPDRIRDLLVLKAISSSVHGL